MKLLPLSLQRGKKRIKEDMGRRGKEEEEEDGRGGGGRAENAINIYRTDKQGGL